jgi:hypothetical protein
MVKPIFHDEKKCCVGDKKNLETWIEWFVAIYNIFFDFFKIIFDISTSKRSENKKNSF